MSRPAPEAAARAATVSTHVLDTSGGRPASGLAVLLEVRATAGGPWAAHATGRTDDDGRCRDLPALPPGVTHARLSFGVEPYLARRSGDGAAFFPEVTVAFAVTPGEHHHVPLLLSPYGYSVYRGS